MREAQVSDAVMKEFARDILAFQKICGIGMNSFAGMVMGAGVELAKKAGLSKRQIIAIVSRNFDEE